MQYLLKDWLTLRRGSVPFGAYYPKSKVLGRLSKKRHIGTDILCPKGTPIFAPWDTFVLCKYGMEGGNTISFIDPYGYLHRVMHLSKWGKKGDVKEGDVIGYTGMTGIVTAPSIHTDISKNGKLELGNFNNFLDPEQFYKDNPTLGQKKNMNILLVIDETLHVEGLMPLIGYVRDFWRDRVIMHFTTDTRPIVDVPFVDDRISRKWLAENIVPLASGYDCVALWLPPEKWANFENEKTIKAYCIPDKILGVQVLCFATTIGSTDTRWIDIPEENDFAGKLRHELSHALSLMTRGWLQVNNGLQYVFGDDNTHYFDFVVKDLSQVKKYFPMDQFEGWKLNKKLGMNYAPIRLFKYTTPSKKKQLFSGTLEDRKVYARSDNQIFFQTDKIKDVNGIGFKWKISVVDEEYFNLAVKSGTSWTIMSVEEANNFCFFAGVPIPERTKIILEKIVTDPISYNWSRLMGWTHEIPTKWIS